MAFGPPVKVVPMSDSYGDKYDAIFGKKKYVHGVDDNAPVPEPTVAVAPVDHPIPTTDSATEFWHKALVGRTITELQWDGDNLESFTLDDGRKVLTPKNGLPLSTRI